MKDPTGAKNIQQDVIEENLELLVGNSEVYDDVAVGTAKKKAIDDIKQNAKDMLAGMKEKAGAQRAQQE